MSGLGLYPSEIAYLDLRRVLQPCIDLGRCLLVVEGLCGPQGGNVHWQLNNFTTSHPLHLVHEGKVYSTNQYQTQREKKKKKKKSKRTKTPD